MAAITTAIAGETVYLACVVIATYDKSNYQLQLPDGAIITVPLATILDAGVKPTVAGGLPQTSVQTSVTKTGATVLKPK